MIWWYIKIKGMFVIWDEISFYMWVINDMKIIFNYLKLWVIEKSLNLVGCGQ